MAFIAKLIAPRPKTAGGMVQAVLIGEAHSAVGLVGDGGTACGGLTDTGLRGGDFSQRAGAQSACA